MELMDRLLDDRCWDEFLEYRSSLCNISKLELKRLEDYVTHRRYRNLVRRIHARESLRSFTFNEEENIFLRMVAYLLKDYDHLFCDNLYSHRNDMGVKKVIKVLGRGNLGGRSYAYHICLADYLDRIALDDIVRVLEEKMHQERKFIRFIRELSVCYCANSKEAEATGRSGILRGTPLSGFLSNLYLHDIDYYFWDRCVPYIRYSDDIIIFSESKEKIDAYSAFIKGCLDDKKDGYQLTECCIDPGKRIEFFDLRFEDGHIDISEDSLARITDSLWKKAKKLRGIKVSKGLSDAKAAKVYIRYVNRRFYESNKYHKLSWSQWYLPILSTDVSLHKIDKCVVDCIRYIFSGCTEDTQTLTLDDICKKGYRSLKQAF